MISDFQRHAQCILPRVQRARRELREVFTKARAKASAINSLRCQTVGGAALQHIAEVEVCVPRQGRLALWVEQPSHDT